MEKVDHMDKSRKARVCQSNRVMRLLASARMCQAPDGWRLQSWKKCAFLQSDNEAPSKKSKKDEKSGKATNAIVRRNQR